MAIGKRQQRYDARVRHDLGRATSLRYRSNLPYPGSAQPVIPPPAPASSALPTRPL